jgi:hypothetical protein
MTIFQGWDISLNHGAVVQLRDGELDNFWYYTDVASSADRSKPHGFRLKLPTKADRQTKQMLRLAWIERWLDKTILVPNKPDFVGIEDYAIRAEQGAHYLGEVGGVARLLCWFRGVRFRLHDPVSAKMFSTWDGTAKKDLVEAKVKERWGQDFGRYNQPPPKRGKQSHRTSEDLADGYALARLIRMEAQLRAGEIQLTDLEHDKERRVFIRTTKTYPINLLGREWIHNPDGAPTPHGRYSACSSDRCVLALLDKRGLLSDKAKRAIRKVVKDAR